MKPFQYRVEKDDEGRPVVDCPYRGDQLLAHAMYNKGTAFSHDEREQFKLHGMLPHIVSTIDQQVARAYRRLMRKTDPLEQYIGLAALQDRNETLFYRLLHEHIEQFAPIVYTPTVGKACQLFSSIFRRGRGMWITPDDQGRVDEVLASWPHHNIRLIVVTDNERILGLGDQGAGGIGIPIGKLALYTVAAGIHPSQVLPISLDVGTDNQERLDDPYYVGWPHKRLRGERYDELIEEFVKAVKRRFPAALLQWEDFKKGNAFRLLDRYKKRLLSFNDDIQGTAAVALAGVMAAARKTGVPMSEQRVVTLGAGAAGVGIGRQLRDAFIRAGVAADEVASRIVLIDSKGPLVEGRKIDDAHKREFVIPTRHAEAIGLRADDDFLTVVKKVKPTVLIGTSGEPGSFTEEVVRAMASAVDRPAIFPFSNPTANSEAVPEDLFKWTDGRCVVATGSPFDPVEYNGKTHRIGQGNNVYIFPGVGLGALIADASEVTDAMFTVAADTLAHKVSDEDLDQGALFPSLTQLRDISAEIAARVAVQAGEEGVGERLSLEKARERVKDQMWTPDYVAYRPVRFKDRRTDDD